MIDCRTGRQGAGQVQGRPPAGNARVAEPRESQAGGGGGPDEQQHARVLAPVESLEPGYRGPG